MSENVSPRPVWLILSVILNALLVGLFLGNFLGDRRSPPAGPQGLTNERALVRGIEARLDGEAREDVRRAFRQAFQETRPLRREQRLARIDIIRKMTAEPYDAEAVEVALLRLNEADQNLRRHFFQEVAKQLGQLSAEERRELLASLSEPRRFRRGERPPSPE